MPLQAPLNQPLVIMLFVIHALFTAVAVAYLERAIVPKPVAEFF